MYTARAIEEARKQGYTVRNKVIHVKADDATMEIDQDIYFTLHDPAFWMLLGRARNWTGPGSKLPKWTREEGTALIIFYPDNSWASWMHRYVDHAIEHGYSAHQAFFQQFYGNI